METKPLAQAGRLFLTVRVWPSHVEIVEGLWPTKRHSAIPLRNIARVDIERGTQVLVIHTNDGRKRRLAFGSRSKSAAIQYAILAHL